MDNFQRKVKLSFGNTKDVAFADVTLAYEDGGQFEVHKLSELAKKEQRPKTPGMRGQS